MNSLKKKLLISSVTIGLATILSVTASVAWFGRTDILDTNQEDKGISGSVLTSYFHTDSQYVGDGSQEKPFVITRPVHYDNLIWLHNNVPGFYKANNPEDDINGKGFYFEIGHDLDGSGTKKVYAYDDNGAPILDDNGNPTYSTELNLKCFSKNGNELIPLGSPQYPFIGELNGNNIDVSGFKVVAIDKTNNNSALEDIGIFGYVGPSGRVHNVYYSDFTIDTEGATINDETEYEMHTEHSREGSEFPYPCIGSLAGHIMYAQSFENVYVNNATVQGIGTDNTKKLDNYSYYGVVEEPTGGGQIGSGNNYNFTFSTSAVFNYMRRNYNDISSAPMRARNTEYVDELVHEDEFNTDNSTKTPFTNGVRYVTSGLNSYNFIGDDPDDYSARNPYQGHNYSLSTIGYQPLSRESKIIEYQVHYKDEDGTVCEPAINVERSDMTYEQQRAKNEPYNGYNYAWDEINQTWKYYHMETEPVDPRKVNLAISVGEPLKYMVNNDTNTEPTNNRMNVSGILYIDNVPYTINSSDINYTFTYTSSREERYAIFFTRTVYEQPYFQINSFNITLPNIELGIGTHHISLVFRGECSSINAFSETWIAYSDSVAVQNIGTTLRPSYTLRCTPKDYELDQHAVDGGTYSLVLTNNNTIKGGSTNTATSVQVVEKTFQESDKKPFIITDGWNYELYGVDLRDNTEHRLDNPGYDIGYDDGYEQITMQLKKTQGEGEEESTIEYDEETGFPIGIWEKEDGTFEEYVPTSESEIVYETDEQQNRVPVRIVVNKKVREPCWMAVFVPPKSLSTHAPIDEDGDGLCDVCGKPYNPNLAEELDKPVYIADDPTLVESGYSADNIDVVGGGFQFSNGFVTIDGEDNRALTTPIATTDIGTKWYATQHSPNSIVLYLSNVGGLNEHDWMGDIEFDYAWTTAGGNIQSNFKSMVFKKGGRNGYVYMNNQLSLENGDYDEVSRGTLSTTVKMKLRRGIIKKCAYCALDRDGNILCGYDSNGNQVAYTGSINESQIATYVLLVGVKNNITWLNINTRIEEIRFSYKAPRGFGGNFGSVEYRDPNQKVESTILNFYFLVPENDKFRVHVVYTGPNNPTATNKGRYEITFDYYSMTNQNIEVLVYLYNITAYEVYLNNARVVQNVESQSVLVASNPSAFTNETS